MRVCTVTFAFCILHSENAPDKRFPSHICVSSHIWCGTHQTNDTWEYSVVDCPQSSSSLKPSKTKRVPQNHSAKAARSLIHLHSAVWLIRMWNRRHMVLGASHPSRGEVCVVWGGRRTVFQSHHPRDVCNRAKSAPGASAVVWTGRRLSRNQKNARSSSLIAVLLCARCPRLMTQRSSEWRFTRIFRISRKRVMAKSNIYNR